uniref:Uncharacterized protein n=1 Tax=Arundo donax TaxID=35708 RepID=A0A0A9BTN5_ARUDO
MVTIISPNSNRKTIGPYHKKTMIACVERSRKVIWDECGISSIPQQ